MSDDVPCSADAPYCALVATDPGHFLWRHVCQVPELNRDTGEVTTERRRVHSFLPLGGNGWTLEQSEPLTLAPSILCERCQVHGFWSDGSWVPA